MNKVRKIVSIMMVSFMFIGALAACAPATPVATEAPTVAPTAVPTEPPVVYGESSSILQIKGDAPLVRHMLSIHQQDLTAQVVFRPSSRSKSISNLYLTGASTHPGGGVPTVMASGIIAANLIDQNEK